MRIGVGISGGVDSALAAALLLKQGAEVIGYTMLLTDDSDEDRAENVAGKLGIPLKIVDVREAFDRCVLAYFADEYARGRTPSPCCRCNPMIKFGRLWERMADDGCEKMATGHYARLGEQNGQVTLHQAVDKQKDQSYFLARLTQRELGRTIFPLGDLPKSQVKEQADALGLVPKEQKESQDLCFVPNGAYATLVAARHPELIADGWIVDETSGKRLGRHHGAFNYTVGQRRGLGLGGGPWYVTKVDMAANQVLVSHGENLLCQQVRVSRLNWLGDKGDGLAVRMRYLMTPVPAQIQEEEDGTGTVLFQTPAPLVPAGQLAVAYRGEQVIASGWID